MGRFAGFITSVGTEHIPSFGLKWRIRGRRVYWLVTIMVSWPVTGPPLYLSFALPRSDPRSQAGRTGLMVNSPKHLDFRTSRHFEKEKNGLFPDPRTHRPARHHLGQPGKLRDTEHILGLDVPRLGHASAAGALPNGRLCLRPYLEHGR